MPRKKIMTSSAKFVRLSPETQKAVDDYRYGNRIAVEAEALRELIELGLEAARKGQPKKRERAA